MPERLGDSLPDWSHVNSDATDGLFHRFQSLAELMVAYTYPVGWRALNVARRKSISQLSEIKMGTPGLFSERVLAVLPQPRSAQYQSRSGPYLRRGRIVSMIDEDSEFSRLVALQSLKGKSEHAEGSKIVKRITATADECSALAERFGYKGLTSLQATINLKVVTPESSRVRVRGIIEATVETSTLGKVQIQKAKFEEHFKEYGDLRTGNLIEEGNDDIPLVDGNLDVGEAVAQNLYLTLGRLERQRLSEQDGDAADGTVVFDSDPGLADLPSEGAKVGDSVEEEDLEDLLEEGEK